MNYRKKMLLCFCVIFCISFITSFIYVRKNLVHPIETAYGVMHRDGFLYGIDLSGENYYIFKTELKSQKSNVIRIPREKNGYSVEIRDLAIANNGNVYVYRNSNSQKKMKEEIVLCDFKRGVLLDKYDVSDICEGNYWFMESEFDKVQIFSLMLADIEGKYVYQYHSYGLDEKKEKFEHLDSKIIYLNFQEIFLVKNEQIILGDGFGSFFKQKPDGTSQTIFTNNGSKIGKQNTYVNFIDGIMHFKNLNTGKNYKINLNDSYGQIELCTECGKFVDFKYESGEMKKPSYSEKGGWTAYINLKDNRYVPFLFADKNIIVDKLVLASADWIRLGITSFGILFLILSGMFSLYLAIKKWNNGVFPVAARMVLIMIPLLAFCYLALGYQVEKKLSSDMISQERERLYWLGMDRIKMVDLNKFVKLTANDITQESIMNLYQVLNTEYDERTSEILYDEQGNILENSSTSGRQLFFSYKNGEIYNLTDIYTYNIPIKYEASNKACKVMKKAAEEKKTISTYYDNQSGKWLAVFIPIQDKDGNVIGIVESSTNALMIGSKVAEQVFKINNYILYVTAGLLLILVLVVSTALHPLGALRKAVAALMEGNSIWLKVKGNSEISAITNVFNRMSVNLSGHMKELQDFQDKYAKFVPKRFFELLDKKDVRAVKLGDMVEIEAVILSINTNDFARNAPQVNSKETFGFINLTLNILVPNIQNYGGVIERFLDSGAAAFFTGKSGDALHSAIAVLQKLQQEEYTFGGKPVTFGAGICQGNVKLGIIGEDSRMSTSAFSEFNNLSAFLQEKSEEYGAKILITGKVAKSIEHFEESYHYRLLGYIYIHITDHLEKIYDVFDGDEEEQRRLKLRTKDEFDRGLSFFLEEKLKEARGCFVEVLRINRRDLAAQKYFYLCDKYLNEKDIQQVFYIESYE